jgi:diacylglycerol kinase (ATP)
VTLQPGSRVFVIINPISGPARRGSPTERIQLATSALESVRARAEIQVTERADHAHELSQAAVRSGAELVIAWGGDGTINEVARALVRSEAALGIVPGGSGNGLARELGVPFDPRQAIARALRSPHRTIDAGELGGRLFFNVAGVGLDAHVAGAVARRLNHRGLLPYTIATGRDLLRYLPVDYSIDADGRSFRTTAMLVALGNSKQYGLGARVAPAAILDDGLLDLVIIEDRGFAGNLVRLPSLFSGRLDTQRGVNVLKVRDVRIRSERPMMFHVDGEAFDGGLELVARVHAGALRVCG